MRPSLLLAALVVVTGCRKPEPAVPPPAPAIEPAVDASLRPLTWVTHSARGSVARQLARAPEDCTLSCAPPGGPGWARPGCAAVDTDFRFVSDDCGQVVILYEYPKVEGPHAQVVVGAVYGGEADPVPLRLGRFMLSSVKLRITGRRMMWLGGVLGAPGNRPHLRADGSGIEFVTIDQAPHTLSFAALGAWVDPGPPLVP